mgnify:CR=1 FL=1
MKKILYYIVFTLWYIISLLPLRVLYVLSDVLYLVLYRIVGYRRRTVWTNIVTAFPEMTAEEHHDVESGFYHFFLGKGMCPALLMFLGHGDLPAIVACYSTGRI